MSTVGAHAPNAQAYRTVADRSDFPDDQRIRWSDHYYPFEVFEGVPDWLPLGTLIETADRALSAWNEPDCSHLQIAYAGLSQSQATPGDGKNTIEVVASGWTDLGYQAEALGATDLQFSERDGIWEIIEADILINAEHHAWSLSDLPSDGRRSLLGTLRHEGGHALGLLHPCESDAEHGAPICSGPPDDTAIMYPLYEAAQVELVADDTAGICYLYPSCEVDGCEDGFTCTDEGCLFECANDLCRSDELCVEGRCIPPSECEAADCGPSTPAWVIGCEPESTCDHGLCLEDGSCAQRCSGDVDCAEARACVFDENPDVPGYCGLKPAGKLGQTCSSPDDCEDGECLVGAEHHPVCSRRCSTAAPCPASWSCSEVEDRSVCVPPRAERGCGVASPQAPPKAYWLLLVAGALALVRRRFAFCRQFTRPHVR